VVPMLAEEPVGAARLESLVVSGALASG